MLNVTKTVFSLVRELNFKAVQEMAERYISSSRDLREIRYLVALSEGLGRLTPLMEPFRQLSRPLETTPVPTALATEEAPDV